MSAYPKFLIGERVRIANPLPESHRFKGQCGKVELAVTLYGAPAYSVRPDTSANSLIIFYALELESAPPIQIGASDEMPPSVRTALQARLEDYWAQHPPKEGARDEREVIELPPLVVEALAPTTSEAPPPPLTRSEKIRAGLQRKADEMGVSVSEMARLRMAGRYTAERKEAKPAPFTYRRWQIGDRARATKEVSAALWNEEECLRVGTVVEILEIKKLSACVFDPTDRLRGVADAARGIGGWWIALRNLDLIKEEAVS